MGPRGRPIRIKKVMLNLAVVNTKPVVTVVREGTAAISKIVVLGIHRSDHMLEAPLS